MKKYDYDMATIMMHGEGLPGYISGETVNVVTDSCRSNLIMHDNKRGRVIILPYGQITNVAYGTIPSSNGSTRAAVGFLVGGLTGAMIGAASADPQKNSVIIQYISSGGEQKQIVLNTHPSRAGEGADIAGILNAHIVRSSGPVRL